MSNNCYSCGFFDSLDSIKSSISHELFALVAPQLVPLLGKAFVLWVVWQGIQIMIQPGSFRDRSVLVAKRLFILPLVAVLLRPASSSGVPLVFDWLLLPAEHIALNWSAAVASLAATAPPAEAASGYGKLASIVERQVFDVLDVCGKIIEMGKQSSVIPLSSDFLLALVACVILIFPYLFIVSLFAALMVETIWTWFAVGMLSPLLIVCAAFDALRPLATAALRLLAAAALTVVLAASALTFTMSTTSVYVAKATKLVLDAQPDSQEKQRKIDELCSGWFGGEEAVKKCLDAMNEKESDIYKFLFSGDFYMLFIIGFACVLLLIKAKSFANAIAGANDGSGPAAATIAGVQAGLGAGLAVVRSAGGRLRAGLGAGLGAFGGGGGGGDGGGDRPGQDLANQFIRDRDDG